MTQRSDTHIDVLGSNRSAGLRLKTAGRVLLVLAFLTSLVGMQAAPAQAQSGWTAYNDCSRQSGQTNPANTTIIAGVSGSGTLKDFDTGDSIGVTATFTSSGGPTSYATNGAAPNSGTDAYSTFYDKANMIGVVNYGSSGWYIDLTLTGLDPDATYTFATTANRDDDEYVARASRFTISDVDAATNASTTGVTKTTTIFTDDTVAFSTGYNTVSGYVARWTDIQPGSDGDIKIRAAADTGRYGYGFSVFMLQEESGVTPTITVSDSALDPFSGEPGTPSAAQSYTVSGSNLTDDIEITAPTDFEISLSSGSGFASTLALAESGGSVSSTTIYARFNRATEGTSSGNIAHASSGATTQNVTVNGTAAFQLESWTAYNDCAWASGQSSTNITTYTIPDDGTATGLLVDYATGEDTPVTVTFTASGNPGVQTGTYGGSETNSGTDAYATFHGIADMPGVIQYGDSGWYVDVTFTGLDPERTYSFVTSANRGDSSYNRVGKFTLSDVTAANNTSTAGVTRTTTVFSEDTSSFNTGYNTVNGYVVSWNGIQPGSDGDFKVRAQSGTSARQAYAFSVFKLGQESTGEQYDLTVTTDGNGTVTLNPTGGTYYDGTVVKLTPVANSGYAFSNWSGTDAGDLVNNGDGTWSITMDGNKAVTANFAESAQTTVTFRDGVNSYTGTIDTFIRDGTSYGDVNYSADTVLEWDDNSGSTSDEVTLIRFSHIFTTTGGPVPAGSTVVSATLTYKVTDFYGSGTADGDPANVYESLVDWPEATVTWNNFGGEEGVQSDEYETLVASAPADARSTEYSIDVTDSLQRWSDDPSSNLGWVFLGSGDDGVVIHSSEALTITDRPLLKVIYGTTGPVNHAPVAPVLVQPADEATDVSIPATLAVTACDPDDDVLDVTFYGRVKDTSNPGDDFTVVAIPDTQNEAQHYPAVFSNQTQWISDHKVVDNIAFVTHLGDIVNTANNSTQWVNADTAMDILDAGGVAYSVGPGNHDLPLYTTTSLYPTYFGPSRFSGTSWYQGYYDSDNYNNYSFFSASGMDFILINLQYNPTSAQLEWADELLKDNSDRRAIVASHSMLNVNDTWSNDDIYEALKDNPNLFLLLCGHMHSSSDGAAYRAELGDDGHTIHVMLADYQDYPSGGNGYLRLLRFSPTDGKIYATTYSPYIPAYLDTYPDEMEMVYEMAGEGAGGYTVGSAWEVIGTDSGVSSCENASVSWAGLSDSTEYEWYTVSSDGVLSTTSSIWSFITGESAEPGVQIEKTPDAQLVRSGDAVTFTIDISNTGNLDLTGVTVTDPSAPACAATIGSLAVGAHQQYQCSLAGVTLDFTNVATVTGTSTGGEVSDTDTAAVDVVSPAIGIEKSPDSQTIRSGDTVTFTITVTNTGDTYLSGVVVTDPLAPTCSASIGTLAGGAHTTYTCAKVNVTAGFTNTATATGAPPVGSDVSDTDTAAVAVLYPAIQIEKTPDTQTVLNGSTVTFTIDVTNTGDCTLTGVAVVDAQVPDCSTSLSPMASGAHTSYTCSKTNVTSDFTNVAQVSGTPPVGAAVTDTDDAEVDVVTPAIEISKTPDLQKLRSGDEAYFTITVTNTGDVALTDVAVSDPLVPDCNKNIGSLSAGASDTYVCSASLVEEDFTNLATATGTPPEGEDVSDTDDAEVDIIHPDVAISKTPDEQMVQNGGNVDFTITVTNTGDDGLTRVEIYDPLAPDCEWTVGALASGAHATHTCSLEGVTVDFTNVATVSATPASGSDLFEQDEAEVDVIHPAITISKTPDDQTIRSGDSAQFTITVTNTGDVPLTAVAVTDVLAPDCAATIGTLATGAHDTYTCSKAGVMAGFTNVAEVLGTPAVGPDVTDDDSAVVTVINPAIAISKTPDEQTIRGGETALFTVTVTNTGDSELTDVEVEDALAPDCDEVIGTLAAGAHETYTCSRANVTAGFTNVASVRGTPAVGADVTDSDSAEVDVINPAIAISKTPDNQTVRSGDEADFTITVTNTGDVGLVGVQVTDALAPDCAANVGILASSAHYTYICSQDNVTADFTNVASVSGTPPLGADVSNSDSADVDVIEPAIEIAKTPDSQTVKTGDTVTFTITVTNSGDSPLTGVAVTDALVPDCDRSIGALVSGGHSTYTCSKAGVTEGFTNVAQVRGAPAVGADVTDADSAEVAVVNPVVVIDKEVLEPMIASGAEAVFTITVSNLGDTPLTDVTVTDAQTPDCDQLIGGLAVGGQYEYTCAAPDVTESFTNVAAVSAGHIGGGTVDASASIWQGVDRAPFFTSTPVVSATQNVTYTYAIVAVDPDVADVLTLSMHSGPGWLTLDDDGGGTGTLSGMTAVADDYPVELWVTDAFGLKGTQTFTITVGVAPGPTSYFLFVPVISKQ